MQYLTADDVLRIAAQVPGATLRSRDLLESGVGRPRQSLFADDAYPHIHAKAAALMHSLVNNHAFVNGNKRIAVLAVNAFYNLNGWMFTPDHTDIIDLVAFDIAESNMDWPEVAEHLAKWAVEIPDDFDDFG